MTSMASATLYLSLRRNNAKVSNAHTHTKSSKCNCFNFNSFSMHFSLISQARCGHCIPFCTSLFIYIKRRTSAKSGFLSKHKIWISLPIAEEWKQMDGALGRKCWFNCKTFIFLSKIPNDCIRFSFCSHYWVNTVFTMLDSNWLWNGKWATAVNAFLFLQSFKYLLLPINTSCSMSEIWKAWNRLRCEAGEWTKKNDFLVIYWHMNRRLRQCERDGPLPQRTTMR